MARMQVRLDLGRCHGRLQTYRVAEVLVEKVARSREAFGAGGTENQVRLDRATEREYEAAW